MDSFSCDCRSCNPPGKVRAIDLIDQAHVIALMELAQDPRQLFRREDSFGLYLAPWYKSTLPAPCLFRCMAGALNQIIFIRAARFGQKDGDNIRSEMAWIRDEISNELPASLYSELLARRGDRSVEGMVNVALAHWVEAARAYDSANFERAWPALTQAHLYIGLSTGPQYAIESSARGGTQRAANYEALGEETLRILQSLPDKHFSHISDAKKHIAEELRLFGLANPKSRTTSPRAFLDSSSRKKGRGKSQIAWELERVSTRLTGRPQKKEVTATISKVGAIKVVPPMG